MKGRRAPAARVLFYTHSPWEGLYAAWGKRQGTGKGLPCKDTKMLSKGGREVTMEIEFDVKITPGVLYDYMLYHTYTSASGLIGQVVGALLVVAFFLGKGVLFLIAGIVILAYLPWTLFIKSRQQYLSNPAFKNPLHYKMTEEGVEVSQKGEVQGQRWEDMYKAVSTPRSLILYTSPVNASIFPKRELGENAAGVARMISTHMPPKKVKIRG